MCLPLIPITKGVSIRPGSNHLKLQTETSDAVLHFSSHACHENGNM